MKTWLAMIGAAGISFLAAFADESGDKGDWTVSGDVVVDASGVICNSITFDGNATVSGGSITLGAGGITVGDGVTATISAPIGGTDNFPVTGVGYFNSKLTLSGANTFTGEMSISKINFHAANNLAFGSPEGKTIFTSKGTCNNQTCGDDYARLCFDGIDTSEPFETYYDENSARRFAWSANTTNILRGAVANKGGRVHFWAGANAYTVLSNDWSGISYNADQSSSTSARFEVFGELKGLQRINFCQGTWVFHRRVGTYGASKYGSQIGNNSTLITVATNVFADSDEATSAYGGADFYGSNTATFDLNGYDQRIRTFCSFDGATVQNVANFTVTSAFPAVLRYDNTNKDTTYGGAFTGRAALSVEGPKTLTLSGASTSDGDLTVAAGHVILTATAAWCGDVRVDDGASLTLMASGNLLADATLTLGETGKVTLNGAAPTVKELHVNGVKMPDNTYGSSQSAANVKDDEHFAGTGIVNVQGGAMTEVVWSGAGGDTLLTNPDNWEGGAVPDFTTGLVKLRFGVEVGCVTVPAGTYRLGAVTLAARNLAFRPADETSRISFSALTYETEEEGTFVCTNAVPLQFELSQTWTLADNAAFYQAAPMSSSSPVDWIIDGGEFHVTSPSGTPLEGSLTIKNARFYWEEAAALGTMRVTYTTRKDSSDRLNFYGGVIPNDINLVGDDQLSAIHFKAATTTEFAGVYNYNSKYDRSTYGADSKVIFSGGVRNGQSWRSIFSVLVFTNKPCEIGSFNSRGALLQIWTTNNTYGAYAEGFLFGDGNTRINLRVPYAANTNLYNGSWYPQLQATKGCAYDIYGCDQQFTYLCEYPSRPMADGETWTLTSATPAQLKACQTRNETLSHLVVNGAAGLTLNGPKALTLAKQTCPTTGRLEVEDGTLTLGEGECFPNLSEVRVTGGTFAVTAADQLNRKADWYVDPSNGKVSVPVGVTLRGHKLYFKTADGWALQPGGDYSSGSGFVTGGGTLHMTGNSGSLLLIR